jgi:hypothetical protein
MTTAVLSPLRKQGDISKVPAAPTAVLLQGSSAPPTATTPRTQGTSTSPTATLACTQGSDTSLPDTLAHSYTPIVHLDPLLASIKGRSRALMREGGRAGGRADEPARSLSLSLANACNPYCKRIPPWRRITRAAVSPFVFHLAPTHLGWDTQRQFYSSVQGPPGVETPTTINKWYMQNSPFAYSDWGHLHSIPFDLLIRWLWPRKMRSKTAYMY